MPGIMRLFVRVEGQTPFALILADNLLPEHLIEIALQYYKETWHLARQQPELVLLRRIVFKNNDQLLDFKKKKKTLHDPTKGADEPTESTVKVYDSTNHPARIRQEMIVSNPTSAMAGFCETELVVKNCTLNRFIMKITDPTTSPFLEEVFWDTYRAFSTPAEILQKLIDRYEVPYLVKTGDAMRSPLDTNYYNELRLNVQLKVVSCLENWVSRYFFDFAEDKLYFKLRNWVREKIDRDGIPTRLIHLMKTGNRTALKNRRPVAPPGIMTRSLPPTAVFSEFHPQELANQLTLLTLHVHNNLFPCELLGRKWDGPEAVHVPNFLAYRDFINRVSNWVSYAIVSEMDQAVRINNYQVLLLLCEELLRLRNWDLLVAVHGGLSDQHVARLTNTTNALPDDARQLAVKFEELLSIRGSSKTLKTNMAASARPHFPSIVVHLRDLLHIEEMPVYTEEMINVTRCIHQHNLVRFLLDGKNAKLEFVPNLEIQGIFSYWRVVDESILSSKSLECQP